MSHVTCHIFSPRQSKEAYWWRVCYQRGLPRLVLSDVEESKIRFPEFQLFRVPIWLNQFVYITTNHSCCPLNCSSVLAKSPICRSPNTYSSCSTTTSPSAAVTSMLSSKQLGAWQGLPATRPCPTPLSQGSWPPLSTTCPWGSAAPTGTRVLSERQNNIRSQFWTLKIGTTLYCFCISVHF